MNRIESFAPIATNASRVLILGSMPGAASLKAAQYYAHPRNAFWKIMGELFGAQPSWAYPDRVAHLQSHGIALWDTLRACLRPGSLDASISEEVGNDFAGLFAAHPSITHIFFNGTKAATAFQRHVLPSLSDDRHVFVRLPSTSPAHASVTLQTKLKAWAVVRDVVSSGDRGPVGRDRTTR